MERMKLGRNAECQNLSQYVTGFYHFMTRRLECNKIFGILIR